MTVFLNKLHPLKRGWRKVCWAKGGVLCSYPSRGRGTHSHSWLLHLHYWAFSQESVVKLGGTNHLPSKWEHTARVKTHTHTHTLKSTFHYFHSFSLARTANFTSLPSIFPFPLLLLFAVCPLWLKGV